MRVVVDFDRCDSTGLCTAIAPQVFELDDDDLLLVRDDELEAGDWDAIEEAAQACPKLALSIEERP